MIHVCFALYDRTGTYSRFTGTVMLSLFENAKSKVTVHILYDNTLTQDSRDKLIQIAECYGQQLKFYNVEELCSDGLAQIEEHFPQARESHFSIATFYRFFIPELLLPQGIEKTIYLDSDIIVNLDIAELWQIELGDKPLGVVPEVDNGVPVKKVALLVTENMIAEEIYFNAGVLLMNLKVLRNKEADISAGMKFISEYPRIVYFDQDVLNYCFASSALKLPIKFNFYVLHARRREDFDVDKKICHYAALRSDVGLYMNDPYSQLFMDYFIKTPWVDADTAVALTGGIPSRKNYSISVAIPMYNTEEYIGECLDSLLAQTFQDFEVIVVDDCSTDNSVKIVEEYAPKFKGRLKLAKTETNSGGGGNIPRNIGLLLARGNYVYFMDADDIILGTALEILYKAAILYDAEVVYTSYWYRLNAPNDVYLCKDGASRKLPGIQTEFTIDDPNTNLSRLLFEPGEGNNQGAWTKLVKRDLLIKNKIFFPNITNSGDFVWVIHLYCHARRFLRIATPIYFYRICSNTSLNRKVRPLQEQCSYWFSAFVKFAKALNELEEKNKVLAENPLYCLAASRTQFGWRLNRIKEARKELGNEELYKIWYSEFAKNSPDLALLLPFLFSFINEKEASIIKEKEANAYYIDTFNRLRRYLTAKIYVLINKKMDKETIQILSVSDEKAAFSKPEWWQRNGTCHIIDSYTGKVEIVAKAVVEGQVKIRLGGQYVQNPEDKSKRIPYWIDYTELTINGKVIFDTLTPAWHDKAYEYTMNAKAGEEIKINVEWLPHRSDT